MSQAIGRGTIKVVWSDNPEKIHSRMFDDEAAARSFGQTKGDFPIFKLLQREEMKGVGSGQAIN